jgi:hypothetical protein
MGAAMKSTTGLCAAIVLAAGLFAIPGANAQDRSPSAPSMTAPKESPADISDTKLDAAAAAIKDVSTITGDYKKKVADAPADQKQRLIDEANDAMTKAVTAHGLSVKEYSTIIEVAQNDPGVRERLLKKLK